MIKIGRYVCMKTHEHMTCKLKCIMGSAQSKPTSTQHSNKVNIHVKCMKHCYNTHVMQCMKFKTQWNNTQSKICTKTSLILKNSKVNQKSQKLGQKIWNAWERRRNQHTRWRKMILRPKIEWGRRFECLKGVLGSEEVKRIKRNESEIVRCVFIGNS